MYNARAYMEITAICAVCVGVIVGYGTWRCKNPEFTDPLTQTLVGGRSMSSFTDGWGLTHFTFFALLTFLYPKQALEIFGAGVIWEIIESTIKDRPFYLSSCHVRVTTDIQAGWWYGRWQDIVMNSLGQCIGYGLQKSGVSWIVFPIMYAVIIGRSMLLRVLL